MRQVALTHESGLVFILRRLGLAVIGGWRSLFLGLFA